MFSMTCTGSARTPFIHSKRLGPTQDGECRRVSPRKTNKSLHYKKMVKLGRGVQTHEPGYFNGLPEGLRRGLLPLPPSSQSAGVGIRQLASSVLYGRRLIQTSRTVQSSTAKTDQDSRISLRWDD